MNRIKGFCLVVVWCFLITSHSNAGTMQLSFDGTTDGGWTISNQPTHGPIPETDVQGLGLPGIAFDDMEAGIAYYEAPDSIMSMDFTDTSLEFQMFVRDFTGVSTLIDDGPGSADLMVNGTLVDMDLIDEGQLDVAQTVTIDFSDTAFAGIDLTNVTSLEIRAEFWSNGGESRESFLIGVPEPAAVAFALLGLFGVSCWRGQC